MAKPSIDEIDHLSGDKTATRFLFRCSMVAIALLRLSGSTKDQRTGFVALSARNADTT
jgi:hypothetical protein